MKTVKWSTPSDSGDSGYSTIFKAGGLFHFQGGAILFALSCITTTRQGTAPPYPPSNHSLWISDEGCLNPAVLVARRIDLPLPQLILLTPPNAQECWRVAIEAAQSGLFTWILFRPSRIPDVSTSRRLQLAAERSSTRVLILAELDLPHWVLKATVIP